MSGNETGETTKDLKEILKKYHVWEWDAYIAFCKAKAENQELENKTEKALYRAYEAAIQADQIMNSFYVLFSILTLILTIASLVFPALAWLPITVFAISILWNYSDAICMLAIAFYQYKTEGKLAMGVSIVASLQLTTTATLVFVALLGLASGSLMAIISLALGLAFAACMGISGFLEYQIIRTSENQLKTQKDLLENPPEGISKADFALYHEKSKQSIEDHRKSLETWLFFFITMAVISSIGFAPLSPTILALLMIGITAICAGIAFYRLQLSASTPSPKIPIQAGPELSTNLGPKQHDPQNQSDPQPEEIHSPSPSNQPSPGSLPPTSENQEKTPKLDTKADSPNNSMTI